MQAHSSWRSGSRVIRAAGSVGASGLESSPPGPLAIGEVQELAAASILVVEDEEASRKGLELVLRSAGYRVTTAVSAEAGRQQASERPFDLVISDVNLPGADGYQLVRWLRGEAKNREAPILLVSAEAHSKRRVAGLDVGADDFLAKPIDVDELLARVRCHLRHGERTRELVHRSRIDALTGLLNRGAIDEELRRELGRAQRSGSPVSVLLVDIDDFKAINDRYGHAVGDDALCKVGALLVRLLRSTDRLGRFGGDELLAVLPDTGRGAAQALLARLRFEWRRSPPLPRGGDAPVLVSMGIATASQGDSSEAVVRRADASMYAAKRQRVRASQR